MEHIPELIFIQKKYNSVMTEGDKVITISKFIDDHVRFNFPSIKSKLIQINRGIDTQYFDLNAVTEQRKENLLSKLTLSENVHVILLPARITSWKGHLVALDAAKLIKQREPELNFVILFVGSEDGKKKFSKILKRKIKKNDLENKIIFCGNLNDMPAVYSIADIVLSITEPEAFGRISAEASSMTKPIISSNHGGSREIIENSITGWLVEPSNPEKLSEKIWTFLIFRKKKKIRLDFLQEEELKKNLV